MSLDQVQTSWHIDKNATNIFLYEILKTSLGKILKFMVKKSGQPNTSGSPSDAQHKPELHEPVKSDALLRVSQVSLIFVAILASDGSGLFT